MKPSACNSSSATYWGAMQMPLIFARRMVVVSGGASAQVGVEVPMKARGAGCRSASLGMCDDSG